MMQPRSCFRGLPLVLVLALLGFAVAPVQGGLASVHAQESGEEISVEIVDFAFQPATLTVPAGTTVTWTNAGSAPHTVTADDGSFDSGQLDSGATFQQTFDTAGTFSYFCAIHPRMQATVIVTGQEEEPSAPTPDSAAPDEAAEGDDEPATPDAAAETSAGDERDLPTADEPRLAHIHAGTCEDLGIVVYSLDGLRSYQVDADGEPIELVSGVANVALGNLFNEPFSVHVHESEANKQVYLACAEVGVRPGEDWDETQGLTLRLEEQFDSGFDGVATLQPGPGENTGLNLFLAGAQESEESEESEQSEPLPPPGTTYTSPSYGYSLTYGDDWEETENASANGRDRFVLFNGISYVTFTAAEGFGGEPQDCVDDFVSTLTSDPNVTNLELATDETGEPLQGGSEATGAFAVYDHDYTFPNRVEAYTLFVGCIPLVEGEAVLAIVQNVPSDDYGSQIEPREALFRSLVLPQ